MATLTCRTEGCGNADIPIVLDITFEDLDLSGVGQRREVDAVQCGVCGQPITDIQREADDA